MAIALATIACGSGVVLDERDSAAAASGTGSTGSTGAGGAIGADAGAGADAGCGGRVPITTDVLDPGEVYFVGNVGSGSGADAVAHWSTPDLGLVTFPGSWDRRPQIRPTDGRLLYVGTSASTTTLRVFHCDGSCTFSGSFPTETEGVRDKVVPTPGCEGFTQIRFHVSPSGRILYRCSDLGPTWYDRGAPILDHDSSNELLGLGHGDLALIAASQYAGTIVNLETGASVPIVGPAASATIVAARATPDGFYIVVSPSSFERVPLDLWLVHADGTAVLEGTYPPLPDFFPSDRIEIDRCLALYRFEQIAGEYLIVRRTTAGETENVYQSSTDPIIGIQYSPTFVTGP